MSARLFHSHAVRSGIASDYSPIPLSSNPGDEYAPSFSPDGRRVAFVWNGEEKDNFDIYTKAVGSQAALRSTTDPAEESSPVWSPDGRFIAFSRQTENNRSAVFTIPAGGGPERKIVDLNRAASSSTRDLSWSADRKWLAVAATPLSREARTHGLYLIDVSNGRSKQVTFPKDQEEDVFPSFSWSGDKLAFTRDVGRGISMNLVLRLDSSTMMPVREPAPIVHNSSFQAYFCGYPVWTPDDTEILFASNRGGSYRFWAVPVEGSEARLLGSLGSDIHMPTISSQGQLAFVHNLSHVGIWKIDLGALWSNQNTTPVQAVASTRQEDSPKVSPDGRKLVFMSDRSGFNEIWESGLNGSDAVALTSLNSVGVGSPMWSPDGKRIAFDSRADGKPDIYVLDVTGGGEAARVTNGAAANVVPSWSRDGRSLFFTSSRAGTDQIWRVAVSGGSAERVTTAGGFGATPSPDGNRLYYMKDRSQVSELWCIDLSTHDEHRVVAGVVSRGFAPTDAGVYYFSRDPQGFAALNYHSLKFNNSKELFKLNRPVQLSPGLSPDGHTLFYGQLDQIGHDLMMVDKFWRVPPAS